jgi:hypothetical protein
VKRLAISEAGGGLLRALIARSGVCRDRILLSDYRATDWQSLTFAGERHRLQLRIAGADAETIAHRMTEGIEDAEFALCGHIVADIAVAGSSAPDCTGSITVDIEALTIAE